MPNEEMLRQAQELINRENLSVHKAERAQCEDWYARNAFNLEENPVGSRDFVLTWAAWRGRAKLDSLSAELREENARLREALEKIVGGGCNCNRSECSCEDLIALAKEAIQDKS